MTRDPRKFSRGPRAGRSGSLAGLGAMMKELAVDPRFQALSHRSARVLSVAVTTFADADGRWFVKHETLADVVGVDVRTIARAVAEWSSRQIAALVDPPRPLVVVEPWLRPPGATGGPRQGSNTYSLDPTILAAAATRLDTSDKPSSSANSVMPASPDRSGTPARHDTSVKAERGLNEFKNEERARALGKNWAHLEPDDLAHDLRAEFQHLDSSTVEHLVTIAMEERRVTHEVAA